jgi:uncharacterized protein YndB with AHSA1/START domain
VTISDIDSVVSEIRIAASLPTVFAFFVDPDKMACWIGTRVEIDPRPGGAYAIDMNPHTRARGEYVAVEPYSRIVFTWGWLDDPDLPPGSSTIEVTLTPDGDGTHVRLVHRGLLTAAMRAQHRQGWLLYLARLTEAATGGDPGPDPNASSGQQKEELQS